MALAVALIPLGQALPAGDCNRNAIDDAADLAAGTSGDCDRNGVPDECDTAPEIAFALPRTVPLDDPPTALAAADLDGDGDVDIATATGGGVRILRGDGIGGFSAAGEVASSPAPGHIIASDLDGDGDLDLAVPSVLRSLDGHGFVTVILNGGRGDFRPAMDLAVGFGPVGLAAADLDGDGHVDLAAACPVGEQVSILAGKGNGVFDAARRLEVLGAPVSVAAADLNGDGMRDLVAGRRSASALAVLIQGPDLAFDRSDVALLAPAEDIVILDPGGDGHPDLAATQRIGVLHHVLLIDGSGDGTFGERTPIPLPDAPGVLLAADLDGDGSPDLTAASGEASTVAVLLSRDGMSPAGARHAVGGWIQDAAAADADLDGDLDILVAESGANRISSLSNDGSGRFAAPWSVVSSQSVAGLTLSEALPGGGRKALDFDGDGRADLAVWNDSISGIVVVFGGGDGTPGETRTFQSGSVHGQLVAADIDGDGLTDLAAASATAPAGISLLINAGGRDFAAGQPLGGGVHVPALAAADLDGDGDIDLASAGSRGALFAWMNDGTGSFPLRRETEIGRGSSAVVATDLDGDGDLDLATADTLDSRVSILENRGGGALAPARWALVDRPRFLVSADFDGDRRADLVAGGASTRILWSAGGAAFEDPAPLSSGIAPSAGDAVDIDQDGDLDLALVDSASATLLVLRNLRARRFADPRAFSLPGGDLVSGGDVDGDGAPDLAIGSSSRGLLVVRNLSKPARAPDGNRNSVPDTCEGTLFVRGDPDADGRTSIADALLLLRHLFAGERPPACVASGDADADGRLSATDAVMVLNYLFRRGPAPAKPFPDCDADPAPEGPGCEEYRPCAG